MGSGQDGLCRAINFGVQTVYVDFDKDTSTPDTSSFDGISSDCKNPNSETVPLASGIKKAFDPFTMPVGIGSAVENIEAVQKLLTRANAYNGPINGIYNEVFITAIFEFQRANGLVKERSDEGAGNYGPRTRATLNALLSGKLNKTTNTTIVNKTVTVPTVTNTTSTSVTNTTDTTNDIANIIPPNKNEGDLGNVRDLQSQLKDLGYFNFDIDGIYNKRLVDALYAFQLEKKIVIGTDDPGAGYYGPVTKSTLAESYASYNARRVQITSLESALNAAKADLNSTRDKKKLEFVNTLKKIPTVKIGQVHPEIRTLQKTLKNL